MIEYTNNISNENLLLSEQHVELLTLISHMGFVSRGQLNQLYSIMKDKQTKFPPRTLAKWCKRGSILIELKSTDPTSPLEQNIFRLTPRISKVLNLQSHHSITSHNLQSNESIISGLYNARFFEAHVKHEALEAHVDPETQNPLEAHVKDEDQKGGQRFLSRYNLESFYQQQNQQFGLEHPYKFIADSMCSFIEHGIEKEIYIEFDNLTESTSEPTHKMFSYLWYALDHPTKEIYVHVVVNDGSIRNEMISRSKAGTPELRLSNIVTKMLASDENEKSVYSLLAGIKNIHIYISGLKQSVEDIGANMLSKTNYQIDQRTSVMNTYLKMFNTIYRQSGWRCELEENSYFLLPEYTDELGGITLPYNTEDGTVYYYYRDELMQKRKVRIGESLHDLRTIGWFVNTMQEKEYQPLLLINADTENTLVIPHNLPSRKYETSYDNLKQAAIAYIPAIIDSDMPEYKEETPNSIRVQKRNKYVINTKSI